jgi:hypothetical protein
VFYQPEGSDDANGVDFLLTDDWSKGVLNNISGSLPSISPEGSAEVAMLAKNLKPRYHFVGKEDLFYERIPYKNSSTQSNITRVSIFMFKLPLKSLVHCSGKCLQFIQTKIFARS